MPEVNFLAILAAAVSAFVLGGLWYSVLFGKAWARLTGQSEERLKSGQPALIFGGAFLLNLIAATLLAPFLGELGAGPGAIAGLAIGVGIAATSLGVNYLFERRPLGLWLVNAGYMSVQFALMGAILGAMGMPNG